MSLIELKGVSKYFGKNKILFDVDISIEKNSIVGLIGRSGSGKTTILQLIVRYLKPDEGQITIPDNVNIGFTTQNNCVYERLTVYENMEYFSQILDKNIPKRRIDNLLHYVGLYEDRKKLAENLSGGMLRRLDLAVCLLSDPDVIILDELTAGLDPIARKDFSKKIIDLKKMGKTIIMSTHLLDEVEELCDSLFVIHDGRIVKTCRSKHEIKVENNNDEIRVKTTPGHYDNIAKELQKFYSSKIHFLIKNGAMIICSNRTHESIYHLLHAIHKANENLVEIDIDRPDIDDFFSEIAGRKK